MRGEFSDKVEGFVVAKKKQPVALLIYPPVYDFALYDLYLKPLGLLRIARWLQAGGWSVRVVNALDYHDPRTASLLGMPKRKADGTGKFFRRPIPCPEHLFPLRRRFSRYGVAREALEERIGTDCSTVPDIALISSGMTYWYLGVEEVVDSLRRRYPRVPIVVGGIYASLLPDHCMKKIGPDYVVEGEGKEELSGIFVRHNLPVPEQELGQVPLIEKPLWRDAGVLRLNDGCPFHCTYCASHLLTPRFRSGDPMAALALLRSFLQIGIKNIAFYDDALLVSKEASFLPFLRGVVAEDLDVRFYLPNAVHLRYIDYETADLMRRAGFQEVRIGLESSGSRFHEHYDRKVDVDTFSEQVKVLANAGFPTQLISVYVLAGLPRQEAREVEESVRFARTCGVKVAIAEYSPVPGTRLWRESVEHSRYPLEEEPIYHNNIFFPMEWEQFTREDLERLKQLARRQKQE